ncbi:MAG: hypothetical protein ACRD0X_03595 [Thermoanaerobaculia bacterium]
MKVIRSWSWRRALAGALLALPTLGVALAGNDDFTPYATQPGIEWPILDPSLECEGCHRGYSAGHIEPFDTWAGSMMANAARDPIFWAALDVANHDLPGVGEYCLRCHAPKAWLEGRASAALPGVGDADGCALEGELDDAVSEEDFSGLACHLCHRMMVFGAPRPGEDPVYFVNAQYWIDDDADCPPDWYGAGPCRRGPYDYPQPGPAPPHPWAESPYHRAADFCGNCHNVTSPARTLIDENGVDTGIPYPIERTFKEWSQSDYATAGGGAPATTCQNCHMPDAAGVEYGCVFQNIPHTDDLPIHDFVGGNAWVPRLLRDTYVGPGRVGTERHDFYTATIALTEDQLRSRSATLELAAPAGVAPGGTLTVDVEVTNLAGHKLPTGYTEGRRMWLHLEVRDGANRLLFESGAYDPGTAVLTRDPQIKVYESVRGIWNADTQRCEHTDELGVEFFHFVRNDCIRSDNRVPPLGFTGVDDLETQPVGYSYPETAPGSGVLVNWDTTRFQVPLPEGAVSPLAVTATLRYQTASKEYIEFLNDEAIDQDFPDDCVERLGGPVGMSRGEFLYRLWNRTDRSPPVDMVADQASVEVDAEIFADGFEDGSTDAWDQAVP